MNTNTNQDSNKQSRSTIRSLSRMVVGGLMLGLDILSVEQDTLAESEPNVQAQRTKEESVFYEELPDSDKVALVYRKPKVDQSDQNLPYVITGLMVDTTNRIGKALYTFDRITGRLGRTVEPLVYPFLNNPVVRPFKLRFDRLVDRGEGSINRWQQIGADEDTKGRELIQTITFSTIDTSIDYVAHQPEVYELATAKTKSLTTAILDYLRSIFVSLDILLLGIFAKVFRLPYLLIPEPPSYSVRRGAAWSILAEEDYSGMVEEPNLDDTKIGYATGFINRLSAFIIDLFTVGIILNLGVWFIRTLFELLDLFVVDRSLFNIELPNLLTASIIGAAIFAIYNTLMWTLFGNTVGQALLGIRVLTKEGDLPGIIRSFLRATLGLSIAATLNFLNLFFIVFDKRRRGLHDRLFGTVVVYTWDAHPSHRFFDKPVDKLQKVNNVTAFE